MTTLVDITDLKPGMFVNEVTKQSGKMKIKSNGWVRSQAVIDKLKAAGILQVEIDPSKTLKPTEKKASPSPVSSPEDYDPTATTASMEDEAKKANKLYKEAKSLQEKAVLDIQAGRKIDVAPFKDVAEGFIDSVFRNQDALTCMTRMRAKDAYLLEHSINVSILMSIFAKHLKLPREVIHELATGALLHDIGKIRVPDEILNKPGKLTDEEFAEIRKHAQHSKDILEESGLSGLAVEIAGHHHERLDGTGYPFGLKDKELSQHVRMISIVDVYDALTAKRVYKDGMNPIQAFKILKEDAGTGFDTALLNQFIKCIGVHPVGTLVQLQSQKLGIVTRSNFDNPLKPWVKTFYNAKHKHFVEIKDINLAAKHVEDALVTAIKPEDFNIDLMKFFKTSIMG